MPIWVASLLGGLVSAVGTITGRVLVSLGIGYAVYSGLSATVEGLKTMMFSQIGSLSAVPNALAWLGVLQVGTGINIVVSAYAVRLTLRGLTGGAVRKMVLK